MRHWMVGLAAGAALLGGTAPARAQMEALAVEVRLDAGIPVEESDDRFDTGVGFGVRASLDLAPTFAVYGGWSRFEFDNDDELFEDDQEFDGFELGGRVQLGSGGGSASPYFMLGALFQDDDNGIEAGLGADYPVSWQLSITPEVRYRKTDLVTYLALGMGARFRF